MAILAADVLMSHASDAGVRTIGMRVAGADTFYRGAIVFFSSGQIVATGPADAEVCGVVAERTVTTAANQIVPVHFFGLWRIACTALTIATQGTLFYMTVGSDNPADLTATATGNTAAVGSLVQVVTTAVDGWVLIDSTRKVASAT